MASADTARLMDGVYRNQRHVYDLTRKYYLLGRDLLIDRLSPGRDTAVLELGCGTGRNLIAAAKRYPEARFFGIDISSHMLETAQSGIDRAGLTDRIKLARGDASDPAAADVFACEAFDRIFYSYTLSMIPVWQEALAAGAKLLTPGGRLSLVDFGQQDRLPSPFRKVLFAWLRQFHVAPRRDLPEVLERTSKAYGLGVSFTQLYRGYAIYAEAGPVEADLYSPATK